MIRTYDHPPGLDKTFAFSLLKASFYPMQARYALSERCFKLERELDYSERVQPICLSLTDDGVFSDYVVLLCAEKVIVICIYPC